MVLQVDLPFSGESSSNIRPMGINGNFVSSQIDVTSAKIKENTSYALGDYSSINNSVINIKPVNGQMYSYTSLVLNESKSIGINVYNSDYINITGTYNYIKQTQKGLTSSAIIKSDELNETGFTNIKVEP